MTIDFGLGMPSRPSKAAMPTWLADLDAVLPHFAGVYDSLWISDHFFWDDNPTIEVWTAPVSYTHLFLFRVRAALVQISESLRDLWINGWCRSYGSPEQQNRLRAWIF